MDVANNQVVEFLENQRFFTAMCIGKKGNRYHLLTHLGREMNLPETRFLHVSPQRIKTATRNEYLQELRSIFAKRDILKTAINIPELWELVRDDREIWSPTELTGLAFNVEDIGPDHEAAVIRAVIDEHVHFKFRDGMIAVQTAENVGRLLEQKMLEKERLERLSAGLGWLNTIWGDAKDKLLYDAKDPDISYWVEAIKDFCIKGEESGYAAEVKGLFKQAGLNRPMVPFYTLVKTGIWGEDENLELYRFDIKADFPRSVINHAMELARSTLDTKGLRDLTETCIFTIDGPETTDIDDALSFERCGNGLELGIHITNFGAKIDPGSPVFEEALSRATSIYLPDLTIPMIPDILSSNAFSLNKNEPRAALSFFVKLDKNGTILETNIERTLIRVSNRMSYEDADSEIEKGGIFSEAYQLARMLQSARIEKGALPLPIPELVIRFDSEKGVMIKLTNPGPARFLVAEYMILANRIAAEFLRDNFIPALYRSQPPPREQIISGAETDIKANFRQRRLISKGGLVKKPEAHHGLGLAAYTTVTSPLRRGLDLLMQQQLDSFLRCGSPLHDIEGLEKMSATLQHGLAAASAIKQTRMRYFVLKHMEGRINMPLDAWILDTGPHKVVAVLSDYLMPVELPKRPGSTYSMDQDIKVNIKKVNARENILKVDWCNGTRH
ncbi:MAG: ribonuclease catalytic domain-containing protein [Dissulfurimicrobium sp.]|uniref:ribonuclease catalytic domain-containing protein n=1 Tax=Dissulfurimicrobium sp. TaxID=2022436 RepID=UPI003D0B1707